MRRLLLCLPLLALPCTQAAAHDHAHPHEHDPAHEHKHHHEHSATGHGDHASLEAHEHGVAQLNLALEDGTLELELRSPAINLLGFEHAPISDEDKHRVSALRKALAAPAALLGLPQSCRLEQQDVSSPLFDAQPHDHAAGTHHGEHAGHHDILASYRFDCGASELGQLDLAPLFQQYPGTERLQVQLIGPAGQRGLELTPQNPTLAF